MKETVLDEHKDKFFQIDFEYIDMAVCRVMGENEAKILLWFDKMITESGTRGVKILSVKQIESFDEEIEAPKTKKEVLN